jgi:hypothetical protein
VSGGVWGGNGLVESKDFDGGNTSTLIEFATGNFWVFEWFALFLPPIPGTKSSSRVHHVPYRITCKTGEVEDHEVQ